MLKFNFLTNRKGTALIVALLVMGVLMAISLALSTLIFRESRITREFLDAGQSYYAAESATEIGLYGLKNNLPGWEPTPDSSDGQYKTLKIDDKKDPAAVAELRVNNKCKAYPCFDQGFDVASAETDLKAFYGVLGLNESITIPMFVSDGKTVTDVKNFTVEYYAGFNPQTDFDPSLTGNNFLSGWDVLRWKLMGINNKTNKPVTENIGDFTAVTTTTTDVDTSAANPSWFGTINCNDGSDRYTGKITCLSYNFLTKEKQCLNTEAREYYKYDYSADGSAKVDPNNPCYSIKQFVTDHTLNYLTLTNLINPAVFAPDKIKKSDALTKLYYRVELFTDDGKKSAQTVREYADITANGYSGNSKQSIDVKIKRDSFMPVFNFSLYSTYMSGATDAQGNVHNEEYWYGKKADATP